MFKRFTYKELTLILGIVVALIVIFTLWIRRPTNAFLGIWKGPVLSGFHNGEKGAVKHYINAFEVLPSNRNNPY